MNFAVRRRKNGLDGEETGFMKTKDTELRRSLVKSGLIYSEDTPFSTFDKDLIWEVLNALADHMGTSITIEFPTKKHNVVLVDKDK